MSEKLHRGPSQGMALPEYFADVLKNKDRMIRVQAKRIEMLEGEVQRLRMVRETLSTRLALVSYQLQLANTTTQETPDKNGEDDKLPNSNQINQSICCCNQHSPPADTIPSNSSNQLANNFQKWENQQSNNTYSSLSLGVESPVDDQSSQFLQKAPVSTSAGSATLSKKQEQLALKYGGILRAHQAASKIQQTFRQYTLNRNFEKLKLEAGGSSRRSRRFGKLPHLSSEIDITETGCSDQNAESVPKAQKTAGDSVDQEFSNGELISGEFGLIEKLHRSNDLEARNELGHSDSATFETIGRRRPSTDRVLGGHDSSGENSPLASPAVNHVDLPSFNFENMLESTFANIFGNDSCDTKTTSVIQGELGSAKMLPYFVDNQANADSCVNNSNKGKKLQTDNYSNIFSDNYFSENSSHFFEKQNLGTTDTDGNCLGFGKPGLPRLSSRPCPHGNLINTAVDRLRTDISMQPKCQQLFSRQLPNQFNGLSHLAHLRGGGTSDSPIWRRKSPQPAGCGWLCGHGKVLTDFGEIGNVEQGLSSEHLCSSASSSDTTSMGSGEATSAAACNARHDSVPVDNDIYHSKHLSSYLTDRQTKRLYRIGLNLFNRKPEKGIQFLINYHFVDGRPSSVAKFLITRKGLSKQMIGEFLGNLQQHFNMEVLECFVSEIDLKGLQIDKALRKFQTYLRMPGEAQKIERLMEAFASCYCDSNSEKVSQFHHPDTIFLLAYAIVMLNTDLHNSSIKPEKKMKAADFVRNLRGIDGGRDIDSDLLMGIYDRIQASALKPSNDHVVQVVKVDQMIVGKKPALSQPHRRLVCYCRLFEVPDPYKRDRANQHQREVFLFNDILVVTKLFNKKKNVLLYNFRESFNLLGMKMILFELPHCKYGIQLVSGQDGKVLITFCAKNEVDLKKFVDDLNEAILEVNEMETLRIQEELAKQMSAVPIHSNTSSFNRRSKDSGIVDVDSVKNADGVASNRLSTPECGSGPAKQSPSGSLNDVGDGGSHRTSSGSLDSGLPSANSGSTGSMQDRSQVVIPKPQQPVASKFSIFARKGKPLKSTSGCDTDI